MAVAGAAVQLVARVAAQPRDDGAGLAQQVPVRLQTQSVRPGGRGRSCETRWEQDKGAT